MKHKKHQKIIQYFQHVPHLKGVYLFGSAAQDAMNKLSDVDIGVLFDRNHLPTFEEKIEMQEELADLLQRDVDLIILNSANPILKHQVLKNGILLLAKSQRDMNAFFTQTLMEYDDLKRMRAFQEKQFLQEISHGR